MRFLWAVFTVILFLQGASAQRVKELHHVTKRIIRYDTRIDFKETPGFICGMIDGDSTYIVDFGSAEKSHQVDLDEHTLFELGSLTKVFTVSLLAVLEAEGRLSFQDKVNELLPAEARNPDNDSMTLAELAMHTSGLPKLPKDFGLKEKNPSDPYAHYTKEDVLAFYAAFRIPPKDKGQYIYSHFNYALLEIIMEQQTGLPFAKLLQEKILNPLGMEETYLSINEKILKKAAKGYGWNGEETKFWTFRSFEASLGLKSTLHDLLIFVRAYLDNPDSQYAEMFQACFAERQAIELEEGIDIAYGWHIIRHKRYYDVIIHPGRASGHQVSIHFVPETQTGVIVLANSLASLDNLGYMMLALVNQHWRLKGKARKELRKKRRAEGRRD